MSKYFLQEKLPVQFIVLRIKRFTLPLIVWSIVGFLIHPQLFTVPNLLLQLATGGVVNVPLYYLDIVIVSSILFWLLTHVPLWTRLLIYILIVAFCFILEYSAVNFILFHQADDAIKNSYGRLTELLKYASLGIPTGLFLQIIRKSKIIPVLTSIIFLLGTIVVWDFPQPWGFNFPGIKYFIGSLFILFTALLFSQTSFPKNISSITEALGKLSFGVYLTHYLILEILLRLSSVQILVKTFPYVSLISIMIVCYSLCFIIKYASKNKLSFLVE